MHNWWSDGDPKYLEPFIHNVFPIVPADWSAEQTSLHHREADGLLGQPLRKGLHQEEEQVVSERNTQPIFLTSQIALNTCGKTNAFHPNLKIPFLKNFPSRLHAPYTRRNNRVVDGERTLFATYLIMLPVKKYQCDAEHVSRSSEGPLKQLSVGVDLGLAP